MLSQITCQDWQQIRDLTSHQSMTTFLTNLYFLSLQCLGMLILLIFLFQDLPTHWSTEDKGKFLNEVKKFYWDDPYLFEYCPDQIFRRCIPDNEVSNVIKLYHSEACGSHFSSKKTAAKILQNGFYWPTMFKDTHAFCKTCENCQKVDTGQKVLLYNSRLHLFLGKLYINTFIGLI